jgi:hypothetical protein
MGSDLLEKNKIKLSLIKVNRCMWFCSYCIPYRLCDQQLVTSVVTCVVIISLVNKSGIQSESKSSY